MDTKRLAWLGLVGLLPLVACGQTQVISQTPVSSRAPLIEPSSLAPFTEEPSQVDAMQIAALGYTDCPYSNLSETSQIGFFGIYPGETTSAELIGMHGDPSERRELIGEPGRSWYYPTLLGAQITVQNKLVTGLALHRGPDELVSVAEILEAFGCPDVMLSLDITPHSSGAAHVVQLVYARRGVAYLTQSFPTFLNDVIDYDDYFVPKSPEAFINHQYEEGLPNDTKLLTWDDAFGERPG